MSVKGLRSWAEWVCGYSQYDQTTTLDFGTKTGVTRTSLFLSPAAEGIDVSSDIACSASYQCPKSYTVAAIQVLGTTSIDAALVGAIAGLKQLPGHATEETAGRSCLHTLVKEESTYAA